MINLKKDKKNYRITIGKKEFKIKDACDGRMFAECNIEDLFGVSAAAFPRNLILRVNSI